MDHIEESVLKQLTINEEGIIVDGEFQVIRLSVFNHHERHNYKYGFVCSASRTKYNSYDSVVIHYNYANPRLHEKYRIGIYAAAMLQDYIKNIGNG